ncbi:capsule biosynthesis GfcC family protein [Vibrio lamellibrachiae]|uniref:capsule biosynthesis GfcC family protein n=1 Tax=Vibrio lamellibrachiae TaxID=2910253 RepID=UPI003D11331D
MKTLFTSWLINLAVLVSLTSYAIASETIIEVQHSQHESITLTFEQAPRLDTAVMTATNYHQLSLMEIDWLKSALFDGNTPFHLKEKTLTSLKSQKHEANVDEKHYWDALSVQLKKWQFSSRIFTTLDPDTTRLAMAKNPRLQGNYQIFLGDVNDAPSIKILGYVKQPTSLPWYPRKSAIDYLEVARINTSNLSTVWVIQPDGITFEYPIAYWNYQFHNIAPGAIIYVPMPLNTIDTKTATNKDTNQLVLELLTHKHPL